MNGSFLGNVVRGARFRARKMMSQPGSKIGLSRYKAWKLKHLPYNTPSTFDLNGKTIHFNNGPELLHSLKEIFIEEVYKIRFDKNAPYIIDCGANIGLAILYLTAHYPDAQIIAFEPDDINFSFLHKNIHTNKLVNVDLRKEAVWKETTTLQFAGEGTLGSRISEDGGTGLKEVQATRLKDLLNRPVDFLKMDIEGAEYEVLKDCADRLHLVDRLFIEFHGQFNKMHELSGIFQMLEANSFAYYIREAAEVYPTPFFREQDANKEYDLQLNIFCFKNR